MMSTDRQYLTLSDEILTTGIVQENRTGKDAKFIPSGVIKTDLRAGFGLLTSKEMAIKACFGEVMGFARGYTSAADFRTLGCNIWNKNANENRQWLDSPFRDGEDDLGIIYGATWRSRESFVRVSNVKGVSAYEELGYAIVAYDKGTVVLSKDVDQMREVVHKIINKPTDRRIIMHAWFPELFPQMALPPCHVLYEFVPDVQNKVLHMTMFQRSCDHLLGVPFNHAGGSFLLSAIAHACGYEAGVYSHQMTNVHLYEDQYEAATFQLDRYEAHAELARPTLTWLTAPNELSTDGVLDWLETINHDSYEMTDYCNRGPIPKVEMAV